MSLVFRFRRARETQRLDEIHVVQRTRGAAREPPVQGSESAATRRGIDMATLTTGLFASAAKQLQELLEADFAIIIDLGSFHATKVCTVCSECRRIRLMSL